MLKTFHTYSNYNKGLLALSVSIILWSLFPILTKFSFSSIPPLWTASLSTLTAAVFFAIVITGKKTWSEYKTCRVWSALITTSLLIGVIQYGLIFYGLQYTSASNASVCCVAEVLFATIIMRYINSEKLSIIQYIGMILMVLGVLAVVLPSAQGVNIGDIIIICSYALSPIGNLFAQRAREQLSSAHIMFFRSMLAGIFLTGIAICFEAEWAFGEWPNWLPLVLINGIIMFGITKLLWVEALHYLPVTLATSLIGVGPFLTMIFAVLILGEQSSLLQWLGLIPLILGVNCVVYFKHVQRFTTHPDRLSSLKNRTLYGLLKRRRS